MAVGTFLRRRLGGALVERLAGPLIGGVYGTPIDELSLLAVVPQLRDAEREHRSLLLASLASGRARKGQPGGSPFVTLAGGTGQLTDALAGDRRTPDVTIRTGTAVGPIQRTTGGYEAALGDEAGDALRRGDPGDVRAGRRGAARGSRPGRRRADPDRPARQHGRRHPGLPASTPSRSRRPVTASSSRRASRWPSTPARSARGSGPAAPRTGRSSCAASSGRAGRGCWPAATTSSLAAAERDIATTLGAHGRPILRRVARWDGQMPHYTVGHLERVEAAFAALADLPGLVLAGAPYRGVGLPDCIGQGRAAASDRAAPCLAGERPDGLPAGPTTGRRRATRRPRLPPSRSTGSSRGTAGGSPASGRSHRAELAREGIQPGADLTVASAAPFGGPLVLQVGRARVALARSVAGTVEMSAATDRSLVRDDRPVSVR